MLTLGMAGRAVAGTIYYDTNGATAGTGAGASDWNSSNTNWTTDSTGSSATVAWPASGSGNLDGSDVVFSAGMNAPAAYNINPAGNKIANSIFVYQGTINLKVLGSSAVNRTILGGGITVSPVAGSFNWNLGTAGPATLTIGASQTWSISYTSNISIGVPIIGNAPAGNTYTLSGNNNGVGLITLTNTISDGTSGGKVAVATIGLAEMVLTGNDSYSGGTSVSNGYLLLDNGGILQHGNVTITSGGYFTAGTTGAGGTLDDNIANDVSDLISLSGTGMLDLTNMKLNVLLSGTQTQSEYVLANEPVGSSNVVGTQFLSATLPAGWSINYTGTTLNPNAIVLVASAPAPEPASIGALGIGGLVMLRRRRK